MTCPIIEDFLKHVKIKVFGKETPDLQIDNNIHINNYFSFNF